MITRTLGFSLALQGRIYLQGSMEGERSYSLKVSRTKTILVKMG